MTLFGIKFYIPEGIETEFLSKQMIDDVPVEIDGNIIYISDSDKQSIEKNVRDMEIIIKFLNRISNTHSFSNIVTLNKNSIEKNDQNYGVCENEFSGYLEALTRGAHLWKNKFFIIRDNFLLHFKDNLSKKPEGVIPLEDAIIKLSEEYTSCLEVETITRRYHLRTSKDDDIVLWLKKLQDASTLTLEKIYEIKETLGQGAFAKVKRCRERSSGKEFAVKIIKKDNIENRENIMNEITILKNVCHLNILKLHHVFETKRHIYLVTDLLEGGELFDLIVKRGYLTEAETSKIMRRILQAVSYLHLKNICHRDIKPENILFGISGDIESVRVTDFGLSKIVNDKNNLKTACGTPSYVAPEILKGGNYGLEVDMWSCGVILYVLLCGFPPFYSDNDANLYELIKSGSYSFPNPYWADISESAKDLITKLLIVEPSKRMTAVQALLHPFITNYRSLSFNRGIRRELSEYLVTQKKLKKGVGTPKEISQTSSPIS